MAKNNDHKKVYDIDEFARHYYCQGARLRQLREDKAPCEERARNERKHSTSLQKYEDYEKEKKAGFIWKSKNCVKPLDKIFNI